MDSVIEEKVKSLLASIAGGNPFGERVTLVAATKTRTPEEINRAIAAGITDVGENKAQEFRDKFGAVRGARLHFIGNLQANKIKYLIGKCSLIHSVGDDGIAREIARQATAAGIVQDILMEVNVGGEERKGGYAFVQAEEAYARLAEISGIHLRGLMAMLPQSDDEGYLSELADRMRALYDTLRKSVPDVTVLSMGMSGDYPLCIAHGANMIRLGTAIFGERHVST